jgi:hypothetical protein
MRGAAALVLAEKQLLAAGCAMRTGDVAAIAASSQQASEGADDNT